MMQQPLQPPSHIFVKATNNCNLNCSMCGQNRLKKINDSHGHTNNLPILLLGQIINQIKSWRPAVTIWGGEPFLHPEIVKLLNDLGSVTNNLRIITNGTLLHKHIEEILSSSIDRVQVSIDGRSEIHDKIRGHNGAFEITVRGIQKLIEARVERIPKIDLLFTLTQNNEMECEYLIELLDTIGADHLCVQYPIFITQKMGKANQRYMFKNLNVNSTYWKGWEHVEFELKSISYIEKHLIKAISTGRVSTLPAFKPGTLKEWVGNSQPLFGTSKCNFPFHQLGIETNGDLTFCVNTPDFVFGSVDGGILSNWNGRKANSFRRSLLENGLTPVCGRCCHLYTSKFFKNELR